MYSPAFEEVEIKPSISNVKGYKFISKLNVDKIDSEYFLKHVQSIFKASKKNANINTITENELKDSLLKYDGETPVLDFMRNSLEECFEDDFRPKQTIVLEDSDNREELSSGLNAKIYFDLLSYENSIGGIYIIDQPEDNVSQPAIKGFLLECFKTMGEYRQILIVTHNPQFIVNLDIDNLIFLSKNVDGTLCFQSGALEYECNEYNVLQLVADNIDGGLDSIQKRWKRYEKANKI